MEVRYCPLLDRDCEQQRCAWFFTINEAANGDVYGSCAVMKLAQNTGDLLTPDYTDRSGEYIGSHLNVEIKGRVL